MRKSTDGVQVCVVDDADEEPGSV